MNYMMHFCHNKKCLNGWIDKDLLNSLAPPTWKYCKECAEKLGIDYCIDKKNMTNTKNKFLTEKEIIFNFK